MPIVSQYEVQRGRRDEFSRTAKGTATITMIDTNGSLDPASGSTDYDPMKPVAIALYGSPIFTGFVARWGYDVYPSQDYGTATIECVDGMEVLETAEMLPGVYGDPPDLGSLGDVQYDVDDQVNYRINQVLDDVGWVGPREIFTGNVQLQKTTYAARQSALVAITDAADAEFPGVANFFFAKDGKPTFHGRLARFNPTDAQYGITIWRAGDLAAVNADPTKAVITGLAPDRDKDRIINSALATPEGLHDADVEALRVENASSKSTYGPRSWSAENLILNKSWLTGKNAAQECKTVYAQYYVTNYAQPQTCIRRITFKTVMPGLAYEPATRALMAGVDISDIIRLTSSTVGGGFTDADFFVEGLRYLVKPARANYLDVTLDLDVSPRAYWNTLPS